MTSILRSSGRIAVLAVLAIAAALWLSLSLAPVAAHAVTTTYGGVQVLDSNSQPVVDARVSVTGGAYTFDYVTNSDGIAMFDEEASFEAYTNGFSMYVAPASGTAFEGQYWDGKSAEETQLLELRFDAPRLTVVLAAPGSTTPPVAETTTPVAPAESSLTAANQGNVTPATGTLTAGSATTVAVGGAVPGETVNAFFFSTPTFAGSHVVAANGTIKVVVPASLAAQTHRLVITNAAGTVIGWTSVTVVAAPALASTGVEIGGLVGGAVALTLVGAGLVAVRRMRRSVVTA